jgi:uncharacterized short protein YbdD (DUF466 family)
MRLAEKLRGVRRLVREATGEAKWDDYLATCWNEDTVPVSRREFERRRTDHHEGHGPERCC